MLVHRKNPSTVVVRNILSFVLRDSSKTMVIFCSGFFFYLFFYTYRIFLQGVILLVICQREAIQSICFCLLLAIVPADIRMYTLCKMLDDIFLSFF